MFCTFQKPGKLTSSPEQVFRFYIQRSNFLNIDFISFFLRHFALAGSTDSSKYTEEKKKINNRESNSLYIYKLCLMHNVRDIKTAFQQQDDVLRNWIWKSHKIGKGRCWQAKRGDIKIYVILKNTREKDKEKKRNNKQLIKTKFLLYTASSTARYATQCSIASAVGSGSLSEPQKSVSVI